MLNTQEDLRGRKKKILNLERIVWCAIGIEVNAGKIKYMVMSRDQNAARSHGIK